MFYVTQDLMVALKLVLTLYPFQFSCLFYFLFMYPVYNRALNLKLNNLKFIFVFFYLVNITFKIFFAIASIFLISVDDAICIIMTRILTQ